MKQVNKPWGWESWIQQTNFYCFKKIFIEEGESTSLQYHNEKVETNYVAMGRAEVTLEADGKLVKRVYEAGEHFSVFPPTKHAVKALSPVLMYEVSTPQVDDVVRVNDKYGRGDGKIEHEHLPPAMVILAGGRGSRLEKFTKDVNKAVLPINEKAAISYLIDKTPRTTDIIVSTGYLAKQVEEYCLAAHPDRHFIFVSDKPGDKTGPGAGVLNCKEHLQRPFYLVTSDCFIRDNLPLNNENWLGVYPTSIPELYSTAKIENDKVVDFVNKSPDGYSYAFIGLASIYDYEDFWAKLEEYLNESDDGELVGCFAQISWKAKEFDWTDLGTIENYRKINNTFTLPKYKNHTYRLRDIVVKTFDRKEDCHNFVQRAQTGLQGVTPKFKFTSGDFIVSYEHICGNNLYLTSLETQKRFVDWFFDEIVREGKRYGYATDIATFYENKLVSRLAGQEYVKQPIVIDGEEYEPFDISSIKFSRFQFPFLSDRFHGDLQFDNVIYNQDEDKFYFVDWKPDFAGSTLGDIYYDLAKMIGGTYINYHELKRTTKYFSPEGDLLTDGLDSAQIRKYIYQKIQSRIPDAIYIIDDLIGIIFLSMSGCHPGDLGKFFYMIGRKHLKTLCQNVSN